MSNEISLASWQFILYKLDAKHIIAFIVVFVANYIVVCHEMLFEYNQTILKQWETWWAVAFSVKVNTKICWWNQGLEIVPLLVCEHFVARSTSHQYIRLFLLLQLSVWFSPPCNQCCLCVFLCVQNSEEEP